MERKGFKRTSGVTRPSHLVTNGSGTGPPHGGSNPYKEELMSPDQLLMDNKTIMFKTPTQELFDRTRLALMAMGFDNLSAEMWNSYRENTVLFAYGKHEGYGLRFGSLQYALKQPHPFMTLFGSLENGL